MNVNIKRLNEAAVIPQYAHEGDAGFDLVATEDVIVEPGETIKVSTGLAFEIPTGYELQVRPRSGITAKTKLRVQLGTIDSTFRGEVSVIVDNIVSFQYEIEDFGAGVELAPVYHNALYTIDKSGTIHEGSLLTDDCVPNGTYIIRKGDRIAQGIIAPVSQATFTEVDALGETSRGCGGFGSSGVSADTFAKLKEDE